MPPNPQPALISVDWGTTSLRSALLDRDGKIIDRRDDGPGILLVPTGGFASVFAAEIAAWRTSHGRLPVLMSGMIGSRQGWREAPYIPCPASAPALAAALLPIVDGPGLVSIVPGLVDAPATTAPDVMRGEETEIIGALAALGVSDGLFVLPGTHSKWATVRDGAITGFATYMTGEIFAALRHHTILGRLMPTAPTSLDPAAFERGVSDGAAAGPPGALLQRLFATRTLGLFDRLPPDALETYLSGLLIGAELAAATATATGVTAGTAFTVVGSAALADRYLHAAAHLHLPATLAPPDCAARGHWLLANAAGLIRHPT